MSDEIYDAIYTYLKDKLSPDSIRTGFDNQRLTKAFTVDINKQATYVEFQRKFIDDAITKSDIIEELDSRNLVHMISHSGGRRVYISVDGAEYM